MTGGLTQLTGANKLEHDTDPYIAEQNDNRLARLDFGSQKGFRALMLDKRPQHHVGITSGWHIAMALALTALALSAWIGHLYHERATRWTR